MKKLLLLSFTLFSFISYSQTETEQIKVYTSVDIVTKSPHGIKEFYDAIEEYKNSLDNNGNILIEFIVDENGKLVDAIIIKGIDEKLDAQALKIIKEVPNWIAHFQKNYTIIQKFRLPISIKILEENNTPF